MVESLATNIIAIWGIAIPVGCAFFHFLSMIPVLIIRDMKKELLYLAGMFVCQILPLIFEMFVNGPICDATDGWFPGSPLGVVVYAFYRALVPQYYSKLKRKGERADGLNANNKVRIGDEDANQDIPALIDIEDYPYDYTYSEIDEDRILSLSNNFFMMKVEQLY